ncbi:hypothetical protein E2C01_082234 [Portunus trituberculatus]|uniref:Uncharacterized protein n=1 Tax=Portunus trituberculatus TaxID=210409 RepID=A0A5B7IYM8_PORTR|nr:hypothetical protein [Portunus trituberculatus]
MKSPIKYWVQGNKEGRLILSGGSADGKGWMGSPEDRGGEEQPGRNMATHSLPLPPRQYCSAPHTAPRILALDPGGATFEAP